MGIYHGKQFSEERTRIIVYEKGKGSELDPESPYFNQLQETCENLFINASDALDLIVTKETINEVKEASGVEIIYREPKDFDVHFGKSNIQNVNSLLITLDNNSGTIYYSIRGHYSSGPLVNTQEEVKEVKKLLQNLGYSF